MSKTERRQNAYTRAVSRRRFIKIMAGSGAALGVAGFGGLGLLARSDDGKGAPKVIAAKNAAVEQSEQPQKDADPKEAPGREKIGEFRTDYRYSDNPARKYNLRLSSQAVDGTVLTPGEVFSMNGQVEGLDYKSAKVFAEGGETVADGGGVCQVTSTVYMAAQYAGLEIVERNAHYTVLPYIRPGFDATLWFGYNGTEELDMKFRNTTDSEIEIREYITKGGFLVAEIWGQPTGEKVTMRSEQDFKNLNVGIKWSTYKKVEKDGKVLRDGLLHEDLYSFPPPESVGDEGYNEVRTGGW